MKLKKLRNDIITMAVLMVISTMFYFRFIPSQIRIIEKHGSSMTSQSFPRALMAAMFFVSLIAFVKYIIEYIKLRKTEAPAEKTKLTAKNLFEKLTPFFAFALIVAYAFAFKYLGYIISTLIFVPAFLGLLRCKNWKFYVGAYVFCAIMYVIFTYILHVLLP